MVAQRIRIFIGCEGASERSYVRWLQGEADRSGKNLSFDPVIAGGGDPLAIVEQSLRVLKRKEKARGKYRAIAILLDSDKLGVDRARDQRITPLLNRAGAVALFQTYDHEAILLRHFPRCANHRPPAGGASTTRLRRVWPNYRKPADAIDISKRLSLEGFIRMLNVEANFDQFFGQYLR